MTGWLRRVLRRPPTVRDCMRAAMAAPCEPLKTPETPVDAGWVRGSGAPPRRPLVPVVILPDEEYTITRRDIEAWLVEHGDDAA